MKNKFRENLRVSFAKEKSSVRDPKLKSQERDMLRNMSDSEINDYVVLAIGQYGRENSIER